MVFRIAAHRGEQLDSVRQAMALYEASSLTVSTFHRFPTLPPELRLRIWHFAMQTPQMIRLYLESEYDYSPRPDMALQYGPFHLPKIESIYTNPIMRPLLLVNAEARDAALSTYLPGFFNKSGNKVVWINPKLDTLYLNRISIFLFGKYEIAKYVEHIALALDDWEWFEDSHLRDYLCRQIKFLCNEMTALKEVQIVAWDECQLSQIANATRQLWYSRPDHPFAMPFLRRRERAIEHFRQFVEQSSLSTGLGPAQNPVTVQPVAIGKSGIESLEPRTGDAP